jgi:nicotinamidase-related amidase
LKSVVDHQSGLCSMVGDFKHNVLAVANAAKYFESPPILTTSFEHGPNGPIVPEIKELFPDAPYIAKPGGIYAWDNDVFVFTDASGTFNKTTRDAAWARIQVAGVHPHEGFETATIPYQGALAQQIKRVTPRSNG